MSDTEKANQAFVDKAAEHEAWRADKVCEGWTYGPYENAEDKLHPCMLPFSQLTAEQQEIGHHVYDVEAEEQTDVKVAE